MKEFPIHKKLNTLSVQKKRMSGLQNEIRMFFFCKKWVIVLAQVKKKKNSYCYPIICAKKISFDKNAIFLDGGSTILVLVFDFAYYWEYSLIFLYVGMSCSFERFARKMKEFQVH